MNFVLGITSFQRLQYLQQLIQTWEDTKSNNHWRLIIADDGSDKKIFEYFKHLQDKKRDYDLTIITCNNVGVHNLTNAIFKEIDGSSFDFCFKVDNDIYFKQVGWDLKYYDIALKTGYSHLIYNRNLCKDKLVYDKEKNRDKKLGQIPVSYGCFYTLNQKILDEIGYFDIENFGKALFGHRDYSIRCSLAGYNHLMKQFDIGGSQKYIEMQGKDGSKYIATYKSKKKHYGDNDKIREIKLNLIKKTINKQRNIYVPYNGFKYDKW